MRTLLMVLSYIGLALTILPSFFVFKQVISWDLHAQLMLAGMFLWFLTAPFWMQKKKDDTAS